MRTREYPEGLVSQVPFYFPYETDGEIPQSLEDEVSSETWNLINNGEETDYYSPTANCGYYRLTPDSYIVGTNSSGILDLNSSASYELGIFFSIVEWWDDENGMYRGNGTNTPISYKEEDLNISSGVKIILEHETAGGEYSEDLYLLFGIADILEAGEAGNSAREAGGESDYFRRIKLFCPSWGISHEYTQSVYLKYEDYSKNYDEETGESDWERKIASIWGDPILRRIVVTGIFCSG